jgi:hypothetical protein
MSIVNLSTGQQVQVSAKFFDANLNPLQGLPGQIVWTCDNISVASVANSVDNLSATVASTGVVGQANVSATFGLLVLTTEFVFASGPSSGTLIIGKPTPLGAALGYV